MLLLHVKPCMTRYFFNCYDGAISVTDKFEDLPDLAAAKLTAMDMALESLRFRDDPRRGGVPWCLEVTDNDGKALLRLSFEVEEVG
jgi:hypothetical protein